MLYGHVETPADRVDHLLELRRLQDETGGFQAFVPLVFHPQNTRLAHLPKASPLEQLRTLAVSRLMLDNFPHVKAYWVSLGVGLAQVALATAPTTSTARSATSASITTPAQSPQVLPSSNCRPWSARPAASRSSAIRSIAAWSATVATGSSAERLITTEDNDNHHRGHRGTQRKEEG